MLHRRTRYIGENDISRNSIYRESDISEKRYIEKLDISGKRYIGKAIYRKTRYIDITQNLISAISILTQYRYIDFIDISTELTGKSLFLPFYRYQINFSLMPKLPKCGKTKTDSGMHSMRYFDFQRCLLKQDFWSTTLI